MHFKSIQMDIQVHLKASKWTPNAQWEWSICLFSKPQEFGVFREKFCLFAFCFDGCFFGRMEVGKGPPLQLKT